MPVAGINGSVDEHTDFMDAGYDVVYDLVPLMVFASRVGGPLASIRAEAARLPGPQLLRDVTKEHGRRVRLFVFIGFLVLFTLDILHKWATHNVHPRPKEVVHFEDIYPLLLELR